jgi:hypothetical protein
MNFHIFVLTMKDNGLAVNTGTTFKNQEQFDIRQKI